MPSSVEIVGLFSAVLPVVFTMASITAHSELKFSSLISEMLFVWTADYGICSVFSHLRAGRKDMSSFDRLWCRYRLYSDCPLWNCLFNCLFSAG